MRRGAGVDAGIGPVRAVHCRSGLHVRAPEVPTFAEAGYPAMTTSAWFGLVAQAKTSNEVITRVNRELGVILKRPEFIARLAEVSFEPVPGSPDDMLAAARKERDIWKKVVATSGAKGE